MKPAVSKKDINIEKVYEREGEVMVDFTYKKGRMLTYIVSYAIETKFSRELLNKDSFEYKCLQKEILPFLLLKGLEDEHLLLVPTYPALALVELIEKGLITKQEMEKMKEMQYDNKAYTTAFRQIQKRHPNAGLEVAPYARHKIDKTTEYLMLNASNLLIAYFGIEDDNQLMIAYLKYFRYIPKGSTITYYQIAVMIGAITHMPLFIEDWATPRI